MNSLKALLPLAFLTLTPVSFAGNNPWYEPGPTATGYNVYFSGLLYGESQDKCVGDAKFLTNKLEGIDLKSTCLYSDSHRQYRLYTIMHIVNQLLPDRNHFTGTGLGTSSMFRNCQDYQKFFKGPNNTSERSNQLGSRYVINFTFECISPSANGITFRYRYNISGQLIKSFRVDLGVPWIDD